MTTKPETRQQLLIMWKIMARNASPLNEREFTKHFESAMGVPPSREEVEEELMGKLRDLLEEDDELRDR